MNLMTIRITYMKDKLAVIMLFTFIFCSALYVRAEGGNVKNLPTLDMITKQISAAQGTNTDSADLKFLEETQSLLKEIEVQKKTNDELKKDIDGAEDELRKSQSSIERYKQESTEDFEKNLVQVNLAELQAQLAEKQVALDKVNKELIDLTGKVGTQNTVVERVQIALKENLVRHQELERLSANANSEIQKKRYLTELALIELNDTYNQTLLHENNKLRNLYETQVEEKTLQQHLLQRQTVALQETINIRNLQASQAQVSLATQSQQQNLDNPIISKELEINTQLSEDLLRQTTQMNSLSQDNLRIRTILDNLKQTEHYIADQLNMLQGTLILSRVINQQRQTLPKDQMVQGLAKRITNLRVQVFNITEQRDRLADPNQYIDNMESETRQVFSDEVRAKLNEILQERYRILSGLIKSLSSQLNLAISIDLNQQQVLSISDTLQDKLQQQSFWVQSNASIDLDWFKNFPHRVVWEVKELWKNIDLSQISQNLFMIIVIGVFLTLSYFVIVWEKARIKVRLEVLVGYVNTLKNDSHWHTPEALFWTVVLALPNTIIFFVIVGFCANILFTNKQIMWQLSLILSANWLFFSTVLELLRPHGIAYKHFGMAPKSNEIFRTAIKKSITMFVLFVISFGFSYIEMVDYVNDVIGESVSLIALILCQFVILPLFNKAIRRYEEDAEKPNIKWLKLFRTILVLIPISLMVLIILGYYYTANVLIKHLLNCYLLVIAWIFARQLVYRIFTVSSRRMAYRRLQEKREQIRQQENSDDKTKENLEAEEKNAIKISTVNQQLFQIADFVGWIVLLGCFYLIWSDLISVAGYLDNVILWESVDGNNVDTITLLNLMRSLLVILVTYALIRNLDGLLEVLFFSRTRISRGVAHTATAILRYVIMIIGGIWSFSNLGLSWTKIQWIFTALSVGLGFGVREIFGSFVSGLILLFERPVRVGDKVTVGQYTGVVTQIRLRSTTLLDSDDKDVVLPNQAFVTDRFINWTLSNTITRIVIPINVAYGSDLDLVSKLLHKVSEEAPKVLQDQPIRVNFLAFGKSALEYELQVHVLDLDDRVPTTNFINYRINQLFKQHNIEIPSERLDVKIRQTEAIT